MPEKKTPKRREVIRLLQENGYNQQLESSRIKVLWSAVEAYDCPEALKLIKNKYGGRIERVKNSKVRYWVPEKGKMS